MKQPKRVPTRIYVDFREMIDPATGELVGCLVPAGQMDRDILRRKKIRRGTRMRTTVSKERAYSQLKYAHKIGQFCEANIEKFAGKDPHDIVKELQVEADANCDHEALSIPGFAGTLVRKVPRSISYDDMEEGEFQNMIKLICNHIGAEYMHNMDHIQVEQMIALMPEVAV